MLCLAFVLCSSLAAAQQMPDPSQINGKAIPAPELPTATVTVRVVRESIGNAAWACAISRRRAISASSLGSSTVPRAWLSISA